ncbi:2-phosphosulfolactate phosphatase [Reinekea marinisedimentorum]|uniref:Probable 2-phosphosulfolactate phosphatase n=1 Tax=Reinekea marinisedimentorum TaxID=230495 RepID=A0A4R3I5T3_9GAMM|nr:2-phosphosulfolactate phosphatase [Reinekea marinisedimentorum]TCS40653.1 2-phosphosulfolactate phosphatase [Reinekea marinisedimentorum]
MRQSIFDIRCEWGEHGVQKLTDECDVLVLIDVLSFTTSVSVAVEHGAKVYPAAIGDTPELPSGVIQASRRAEWLENSSLRSMSPQSLGRLESDLLLPSPNGSALSLMAGNTPLLAGCLRNARATARAAMHLGTTIGIVPAGERWEDQSLRPSWEDLIGAGAIIQELKGERSPEAAVAEVAFLSVLGEVEQRMSKSVSGRELIKRGFAEDVHLACQLNADHYAARLYDGAYRRI